MGSGLASNRETVPATARRATAPAMRVAASEGVLAHQVYADFETARPLACEWDHLAAEVGDIFCTFDWYDVWWRHFGGGRRLEIHAFRCPAGLVAVIPLVRYTLWTGGVPLRLAQIVGADHSLASAGLALRPEWTGEVIQRLLGHLERTRPWDVLHIGALRGYLRSVEGVAQAAAKHAAVGTAVFGERDDCATVYDVPPSYPAYLAGLSGSERRNILRCERRLAEVHSVALEEPADAGGLATAVDELVRWHQALWRGKGRLGQFAEWPGFEAFFSEMLAVQGRRGRAAVVRLGIDGQVFGVECGFRFGSRMHAIVRGYETAPPWDTFSLGRMLHCGMVRSAIAAGVRLFDDGGGAFEYKHRLGGRMQCKQSVIVLRRGVGARLRFWLSIRMAYFLYRFVRRIWIYKLHRLGFAERPIRRARMRSGFLPGLYRRLPLRLFSGRRRLRTVCAPVVPVPWCEFCPKPGGGGAAGGAQ